LILGLFLPLSTHYSLDQALDISHEPKASPNDERVRGGNVVQSIASAGLALHVGFAVVVTSWRTFMQLPPDAPTSLTALAGLGVGIPVFLLIPIVWLRTSVMIVLAVGFIIAGSDLLAWTLAAGVWALVPGESWRLVRRLGEAERGPLKIYFDEDCGFCRKTCYLLRTFLLLENAPIRPAQSDPAVHTVMQAQNTWVVIDREGKQAVHWGAVLSLMRDSPVFRPIGLLLTALGMERWGDPLYRFIARTRRTWSRVTAVLLPYRRERPFAGRFSLLLISIWLAALILVDLIALRLPESGAGRWWSALGFTSGWPSWLTCS
jgi:predicted DCC family thiol-disulfide oxidoreductase YuxK